MEDNSRKFKPEEPIKIELFTAEIFSSALEYGLISNDNLYSYSEGSILIPDNNTIYLMRNDHAGVVRDVQNRKILAVIYLSNVVLGGVNLFYEKPIIPFTYDFLTSGQVYHISVTDFRRFIDEMDLWKTMAQIFSIYCLHMHRMYKNINNSTSYEMIKEMINYYVSFPEFIKNKIMLANYIIESSAISRSNVMKILSMLKRHGFIDLQRGILQQVYQLPDDLW